VPHTLISDMNFLPGERGIASIRLPRQYVGIFLEVLVIVFYFIRISSQLSKVVGFSLTQEEFN